MALERVTVYRALYALVLSFATTTSSGSALIPLAELAAYLTTSAANTWAKSPSQAGSNYPDVRVGNLKDLKLKTPVAITYPDAASPGVLLKLGKQSAWSETKPKIFFCRTASGREVDIVLEDNAGRIVGLEVRAAATLNPNDTAGLRALAAEVGKKWIRGIVLYTGLEVIPFANNLHGVPLQTLWQPIGR